MPKRKKRLGEAANWLTSAMLQVKIAKMIRWEDRYLKQIPTTTFSRSDAAAFWIRGLKTTSVILNNLKELGYVELVKRGNQSFWKLSKTGLDRLKEIV
jgi:hypothetical protein